MVETLESKNPATGETIGRIAITPPGAIPQVVVNARAARGAWASLSLEERGEALTRAGEELVERAEELGTALSREMGKPLA